MKRMIPFLLGFVVCSTLSLADYSDGFITAGEYEYGVDWNSYNPPLIVEGGGADWIEMRNFGRLEVRYTSTPLSNSGGIWDIWLDDYSILTYLNGETEEITITENAEAVLTGGRIDYITSYQHVNWWYGEPMDQHIEMIVKDYQHNTLTNLLTGTWADDTAFDIQLIDEPGYDTAIDNINFTIVPEPATLLLISFGAALIRKR